MLEICSLLCNTYSPFGLDGEQRYRDNLGWGSGYSPTRLVKVAANSGS
ncbi:hypothetical protein [uncultured Pontibacter sp.]|nr:hypothetical protein [uncultured Pontibacter sp.]